MILASLELKLLAATSIAATRSILIPQNVGVFVDHDSYLDSFELACELHTLKQQIAEYVIEQAVKEEEKQMKAEGLDPRDELVLDPNTMFDERFQAVMVDMLEGKHASQIKPNSPGLHDQPEDHETDDENPTSDY